MILSWILIGALFVIALVLLRFKEIRHRTTLFIAIVLLLFLIISVTTVTSANKADLTTFDGILFAGKAYFVWLGNVFHNLITLLGYAIKQDWGINTTNISIK